MLWQRSCIVQLGLGGAESFRTFQLQKIRLESSGEQCASCTGPDVVPTWHDIPLLLKHLSFHEIIALRPITKNQGQYCKPHRAGQH